MFGSTFLCPLHRLVSSPNRGKMGNQQCCEGGSSGSPPTEDVKATGTQEVDVLPKAQEAAAPVEQFMAEKKELVLEAPKLVPEPEPVPPPSKATLKLDFKKPDGSPLQIEFESSPLGLDFMKQVPMKVKQVVPGSLAEKKGAVQDMQLVGVNGEGVEGKTKDQLYELLKQASADLSKSS